MQAFAKLERARTKLFAYMPRIQWKWRVELSLSCSSYLEKNKWHHYDMTWDVSNGRGGFGDIFRYINVLYFKSVIIVWHILIRESMRMSWTMISSYFQGPSSWARLHINGHLAFIFHISDSYITIFHFIWNFKSNYKRLK